ncbi:MAG TPA: sensor histidine kinase [Thermodesulfobacteriota bacterium]|nr:sensor histidine kinase [Thermodesulfobacteriota bacterium]
MSLKEHPEVVNTDQRGQGWKCCLSPDTFGVRRPPRRKRDNGRLLHQYQILVAQETERKRISRALHDELGQGFAFLKLGLARLHKSLPSEQIGSRQECERFLQEVDSLMEAVRRISRDLAPSILEDLGLTAALQCLVRTFSRRYSAEVKLELENIDYFFPGNDQIILYRIFQEAIHNIEKHANATAVSISGTVENGILALIIEDNGCGFDVDLMHSEKPSERGLGLISLQERCSLLGGNLELLSQPGTGTRITLRLSAGKQGKA